ncbi:MAG TPA: phosphatase domain-containing protein [Burkholderiales bacterium]|nr:phosphatase domain-containing protein [Burkholderiales bacterium]
MARAFFRAMLARIRNPWMILPYLGYGTRARVTLCGRVLQDKGFRATRDAQRRWRNLVAFYARLHEDVMPGARVRATLGRREAEVVTDRQGYFTLELERLALKPGWHEVALELAARPEVQARGRVLVPSPRARFGVISDIDDTVVWTNVANKLKMVLSLALSNARTRKPFKGVAAFYRALHAGVNPVFYVSKSPWNLYAPLVEFFEHQGLPLGPLLLRDLGLRMNRAHKTEAIERILATYPRLAFVLIGDSGEKDPEIYADVVRRHPKRVRAIYIRSVNPDPARIAAIEALVGEVAATGCQLVLAPDSELAAAHAAAEGLIQASDLRAIRSDRSSDESSFSKPAASRGSAA